MDLCSNHRELLDHRMPQKLLTLCHCWVAQLVLTWMRMSSVCFVLFLRLLLTLNHGWDRPVATLIQFSRTAGDIMWVSFAIWLMLAPSGLLRLLLSKGWC